MSNTCEAARLPMRNLHLDVRRDGHSAWSAAATARQPLAVDATVRALAGPANACPHTGRVGDGDRQGPGPFASGRQATGKADRRPKATTVSEPAVVSRPRRSP